MSSHSAVHTYILHDEWTMGNGQCNTCCGIGPDLAKDHIKSHEHHQHSDWGPWEGSVGHKKNCLRALAMDELGLAPLYADKS